MDADGFWGVVDETRSRAHGVLDAQVEMLHQHLSTLDAAEVAAFDREFVAANHALYSWTLWGAIDLIFGSEGDDGFTDARSWVMSLGSATYHEVLADPQALAEIDSEPDVEDLGLAQAWAAVASAVYAGVTGRSIQEDFDDRPVVELPEGEPPGTQLSDVPEELAEVFPRLAARFHDPG